MLGSLGVAAAAVLALAEFKSTDLDRMSITTGDDDIFIPLPKPSQAPLSWDAVRLSREPILFQDVARERTTHEVWVAFVAGVQMLIRACALSIACASTVS